MEIISNFLGHEIILTPNLTDKEIRVFNFYDIVFEVSCHLKEHDNGLYPVRLPTFDFHYRITIGNFKFERIFNYFEFQSISLNQITEIMLNSVFSRQLSKEIIDNKDKIQTWTKLERRNWLQF